MGLPLSLTKAVSVLDSHDDLSGAEVKAFVALCWDDILIRDSGAVS